MAILKFKKFITFSISIALLIILVGMTSSRNGATQILDEDAAIRGKLVFEKYGCFVCHGNEGSGGVRNKNAATGGLVTALIYTSRAFNDVAFKERIIRGPSPVKKTDPEGPTPPLSMPAFRDLISDEELTNLVVFLRS